MMKISGSVLTQHRRRVAMSGTFPHEISDSPFTCCLVAEKNRKWWENDAIDLGFSKKMKRKKIGFFWLFLYNFIASCWWVGDKCVEDLLACRFEILVIWLSFCTYWYIMLPHKLTHLWISLSIIQCTNCCFFKYLKTICIVEDMIFFLWN